MSLTRCEVAVIYTQPTHTHANSGALQTTAIEHRAHAWGNLTDRGFEHTQRPTPTFRRCNTPLADFASCVRIPARYRTPYGHTLTRARHVLQAMRVYTRLYTGTHIRKCLPRVKLSRRPVARIALRARCPSVACTTWCCNMRCSTPTVRTTRTRPTVATFAIAPVGARS